MPSPDRRAVVARHAVEVRGIDPGAALSVGNGEFCCTVDITGLQTFPECYPALATQAQWGWHSRPRPPGADLARTMRPYLTGRGLVSYVDAPVDADTQWLRENPHRLNLARISLVRADGTEFRPDELGSARQVLDLWTGVITSELTLAGHPMRVTTACHPDQDTLAVRVESAPGAFGVRTGTESLAVSPGPVLELAVPFGNDTSDAGTVFAASRAHWPRFWESGAALDLGDCTDPRAAELERRAVLSQYLTAIQCAGSLPPQETGLTCNSWHGRFHLEMHWWHAAHFALWGRPELLRRGMDFYRRILPVAQETATAQGYRGARWPKQVGPDGRESPSHIGPFLLWQQPHVIHLAELLRRAGDSADYGELVEQTADFMADIAEPTADGFDLGPPLVPAQESYADIRARVRNPPFELAYWAWGLGIAQEWRTRSGRPPEPHWEIVRKGLSRPLIRDGKYAAIAVEPFTVRDDHPSMVYALGPVPETELVDPEVIRATLHDVLADWDWASTWGWDYPALAMTATRLREPETAIAVLLRDSPKNVFLPNGHNYQSDELPVYLPGNGGLLAALALMAEGWDGSPPCPGFPRNGSWRVRHEGFVRSP